MTQPHPKDKFEARGRPGAGRRSLCPPAGPGGGFLPQEDSPVSMRLKDSGARVPLPRAFSRASVAPSAHWADRGARRMAPGGHLRGRHSSAVHGAFHWSLHLSQLWAF